MHYTSSGTSYDARGWLAQRCLFNNLIRSIHADMRSIHNNDVTRWEYIDGALAADLVDAAAGEF